MKNIIFLLLLSTQCSFGQSNLVLKTIHDIEFSQDTIKSVFDWVTDNIKYDIKKLNSFKNNSNSKKKSKFKTEKEFNNHLLETVIKQKKGVCQDYSLLFKTILEELGYEAHVIRGYSRVNGKINRQTGHAWNAVKVNETWKLYDLTWASGMVKNGKKFVKKYNAKWYDVDPKQMIQTHMPFDPIWQLLISPKTYREFDKNTDITSNKENYQFNDLIAEHFLKGKKLQMTDQLNRSKEMGDAINLVAKWRSKMVKRIGVYGVASQQDLLKNAIDNSNKASELFSDYIDAKNKQFKGKKWSIEKAEQNLISSKKDIEEVIKLFKEIEVTDAKAKNYISKTITQSENLLSNINKELKFVTEYKSR